MNHKLTHCPGCNVIMNIPCYFRQREKGKTCWLFIGISNIEREGERTAAERNTDQSLTDRQTTGFQYTQETWHKSGQKC